MYFKLKKFWEKKYPNFFYQLDYDKLVVDSHNEIKKLLEFCDLSWDQKCLSHNKNSKAVINTVSIYQARKPIYSTSSNLSNLYEERLSNYFKELKL